MTYSGAAAEATLAQPVTSVRPCNIYRDVFGGWRWEFKDARGQMRDSRDSFDSYEDCAAAAQRAGLEPGALCAEGRLAQGGLSAA
jgi:hypothetical protein